MFTMVCWKAGVDPVGFPWYAGWEAGRIQSVYHDMLEGRV